MRNPLFLLLCTLPLGSTLLAQEDAKTSTPSEEMGPAAEQKKFHVLLGHWKGSGTVQQTADAPATKWTSEGSAKNILGGHFVQDDMRVDLGEDAPSALFFKNIYGWDKETKRWMQYGVNNMGEATESEVHWEGSKLLTGSASTKEGSLAVERWVTTFDGADSYSVIGYMSIGSGKQFVHVKGTFNRVKVVAASFKAEKAPAMLPAAAAMGVIHKMAGTYKIEGWMIPAPSAPKTNLTATEIFRPIYGGTGMEIILKGDPIPNMGTYEGYGVMVWNSKKKCYSNLWFSNMGEAMMDDARIVDGKMISTTAALQMGQPFVNRSLTTLNADGSLASYDGHAIIAGNKPVHSFHCTYTKQ